MSELFGFVPAAYSWALVKPSPSGSALPSPPLVGLRPFETSQPSGRPSPSLSALFILVPWFCSSELVRPSPSQSAPPSDGSSGSDPSPLTAETAERARNIAISTLIIFLFMFFHFLYFFSCYYIENPLFSLSKHPAHMMGEMFWDSNDATHCMRVVFKELTRDFIPTTSSVAVSINWNAVLLSCLLFCTLYCASKCIVFHGLILGNPTFPLHTGTNRPYMKSAMQCII